MKQVLPKEYSKNSKNKFFVVDFQHFGLLNFFQCKILILMIPKMIMFKKKNDPICVLCWFWPLWLLAKMVFFRDLPQGGIGKWNQLIQGG